MSNTERRQELPTSAEIAANTVTKLSKEQAIIIQNAKQREKVSGKRVTDACYSDGHRDKIKDYFEEFYQGTEMGLKRITGEKGMLWGYGYINQYSKSFFDLPKDFGINIEEGNFGVFSKEGAQKFEQDYLLDALTDIHNEIVPEAGRNVKGILKAADFFRQKAQFKELFGEDYSKTEKVGQKEEELAFYIDRFLSRVTDVLDAIQDVDLPKPSQR